MSKKLNTWEIIQRLVNISIDYSNLCNDLKKIKDRIKEIYNKWQTNWDYDYINTITEDVGKIFKLKQEYIRDDYNNTENYRQDANINFYNWANCKNKYEVLEELFQLFEKKKQLKNQKWAITRKLYLYWKSLLK